MNLTCNETQYDEIILQLYKLDQKDYGIGLLIFFNLLLYFTTFLYNYMKLNSINKTLRIMERNPIQREKQTMDNI